MEPLNKYLQQLIGQMCWLAVGGRGNGSMVTFHLGKRIARANIAFLRRNQTPQETESVSYKGEFCFFLKNCSWRLDRMNEIICVWKDSEDVIATAIKGVEGQTILSANVLNPISDLEIQFSGEYLLRVFCDEPKNLDSLDNYSIRVPGNWITIGSEGKMTEEPST